MDHLHRIFPAPALAALLLGLAAAPAAARPDPTPPPSGEVIHLFGPNSLTSHILPTGPAPAPAATGKASASGADAASSPASGAASQNSGTSWGEMAHTMFVTGDPSQEGPAALSKGRHNGQ